VGNCGVIDGSTLRKKKLEFIRYVALISEANKT
jgi:hypothetical protein